MQRFTAARKLTVTYLVNEDSESGSRFRASAPTMGQPRARDAGPRRLLPRGDSFDGHLRQLTAPQECLENAGVSLDPFFRLARKGPRAAAYGIRVDRPIGRRYPNYGRYLWSAFVWPQSFLVGTLMFTHLPESAPAACESDIANPLG